MILAEFNPIILFFLLWGLLSWFTKKKKNQLKEKDHEGYSEREPKPDLFARLQKLQEHLSSEVEIFPQASRFEETEEEAFIEDNEYGFEEVEIPKEEPEVLYENDEDVFETDIKVPATESDNWLKQNLFRKSNLRKLIVLKEVLGAPRSIHPYTGDYYK